MTLATYAELKAAISDTLARDDLTDTQVSGFVRMAEAQMSRDPSSADGDAGGWQ